MTSHSLRTLLDRPGMLRVPGAWDAVSAQLIQQAGFEAVYMSGGITSMTHGYPDFGLLDMGEMVANAGRIARSVGVPVIADADTGYGNELNVTRTVREYEMRGVAAIHIEDQVSPKRCGHLDGKEVVSRTEFVSKIRAAVEARSSRDFLVIARTDSRAVMGLDEAVARANDALAAGADIAFIEAMQTLEEVSAIPRRVQGPCLLNVVQGGRTPVSSLRDAEAMGYKIAIVPTLLFVPMLEAADLALRHTRSTDSVMESTQKVGDLFRRFGADRWDALRERFNAGASATGGASAALKETA
jgi:2-methylisocitrate lyase-like PEP mutase family enzyme